MPPERDSVYLWDMLNAAQGVVASLRGFTFERDGSVKEVELSIE